MNNSGETQKPARHTPLEEVRVSDIRYIDNPPGWDSELLEYETSPPVLIEVKTDDESHNELDYTLIAHHRSFWRMIEKGQHTIKVFVVRSDVHINLAHDSISNCIEEANLFSELLRNDLVDNRSRLSELLGYSRARITQMLNLLKLPDEMRRKLLLTDDISEFQLRSLVRITDTKQQKAMFDHLLEEKSTGRQMALFAKSGDTPTVWKDTRKETETTDEQDASFLERVASKTSGMSEESKKVSVPSRGDIVKRVQRIRELLLSMGILRADNWEQKVDDLNVPKEDVPLIHAISLLRSGIYDEAFHILEVIVNDKPDNPHAFYYLGKCSNLQDKLQQAERYFRAALELIGNDTDYMVELAIVLEKLGRHTEAATFYRTAGTLKKKKDNTAK